MALNIFGRLLPRDESFTALFCEQTQRIGEAALELNALLRADAAIDARVASIRAIEMAADSVAKKIFVGANRTFNAPIDREDILALAHALDDTVDLIEDTAKAVQRYGVRDFGSEMHAMGDAVVECAEVLRQVMPYLDSITRDYKTIFELCERIGQIEGRADESFDGALVRLHRELRSGAIETIDYIDRKELYELVENVVDRCDDVANAVQSITTKHV